MPRPQSSTGRAQLASRRRFLAVTAAGTAGLLASSGLAEEPAPAAGDAAASLPARISIRVGVGQWIHPQRLAELKQWVTDYRDVIDEVAFFTGFTHPPLPLPEIVRRAEILTGIVPEIRALGVSAGINHLATIGHLDENLEHSLREPWQHLVDIDGAVSASCYCVADPDMQTYVRDTYVALAGAKPDFLWVDDDVRMENHGPIRFACFCDRCMARFSRESGRSWTRPELVEALRGGTRPERLTLRRQWLAHNRAYLGDLLARIREAVDRVDPAIVLGMMSGETSYSGYGFGDWVPRMAGPKRLPVKWRPGGGFYTDETPLALLDKAHSVGRQIAWIPDEVSDIQYEHENFPYQRLKKSVTIFCAEIATAIGAGCTGAALNCLGIADDPAAEFRPYFDGVRARRTLFDRMVATFGRSRCEGVWSAFTRDSFAALQADGDWFAASSWGASLRYFNEMAEIGIPAAYTRQGARVAALTADGCLDLGPDELRKLLSGGVLLDIPALFRLHELGLGEYTGFAARTPKEKDTIEQFTADPLNGAAAGWHRDCRPSFYPEPAWLLDVLSPAARPLSEIVDFAPQNHGPTSGVFENALGGRVAVFGYYPWRSLQSAAKTAQLRRVCRWLSRDTLPAYVQSYAKAALWCRRDSAGRPAMLLFNASADTATDLALHVRDVASLDVIRAGEPPVSLTPAAADAPYAEFRISTLGPWEAALLTTR